MGILVDVSGKGNGEGSSSTERECGFRNGPEVMGRDDTCPPRPLTDEKDGRGVGGGDVPSLLRSLRVMGGRECASSDASDLMN